MITFGKNLRIWAIVYALVGGTTCLLNLWQVSAPDQRRFLLYLVCANIAALGLRLASNRTLIPAGLLILLLGVEELSLPELLFIAFTVTLLRDFRSVRRVSEVAPVLYSIASVTIGMAAAHAAYHAVSLLQFNAVFPAPAIASSFVLLFNCGLATALLQDRSLPFTGVYRRECRPLLPWFVAAAYLAYLVRCTSLHTGYHAGLIALPILFALDRGYQAWATAKSEHREELEALHRHTLETLAVAIDTRDRTNHLHLRRVQTYALAVGRELGLSEAQLQSLNVAALLHDIGKLGIPDHILLKPGPLTSEEWEKMKTHPMMGAEMLSRMNYPEAVLSIVQAHHEKWNGAGYPLGLAGEEIPIGARILSAVDGLDALGSDRPYRNALPLREAMNGIRTEAGKSYDPLVVAILERRHVELEQAAAEADGGRVLGGSARPAGCPEEESGHDAAKPAVESGSAGASILDPISSARQETQLLQGLAGGLAQSLRIEEVAASLEACLRRIVRYDSFALYVR
ncbi:MAG: HD-GYP domain-containing protein, partial [Bryobacteraceae bacterium]